ncbi:hypothetical protein M404DRAFT_999647 [Pisolithus tinctorius Marx 270]|uniref:Uncharacterized protein n=1 Tax=Pisolithus tinctorius Marx 270 TaxID=870435 RepID=A0A0C3K8M5_PISTI|nr:hypothetical protein M404DRAFT_999647 [Pisolithus tinctorius Marx 270]
MSGEMNLFLFAHRPTKILENRSSAVCIVIGLGNVTSMLQPGYGGIVAGTTFDLE